MRAKENEQNAPNKSGSVKSRTFLKIFTYKIEIEKYIQSCNYTYKSNFR